MESLTDLEAAAIGDILNHQPCTAHFMRTCFRESQSHHFSDSAGSVYPMMKRLDKRGLLKSTQKVEGSRKVRYYSCTEIGKKSLRRWLGPPIDESVTMTIDPIRTRILYLKWLPKQRRAKWFLEVETALREKLLVVKRQLAVHKSNNTGSIFCELADENAMAELKSRLGWLSLAKKRLVSEGHL